VLLRAIEAALTKPLIAQERDARFERVLAARSSQRRVAAGITTSAGENEP
jgi:hypothetical protein